MKRILSSLTALVLFCLAAEMTGSAQNYQSTPVTVSTALVKMGGNTYYSHTVLERQTLFSISKAYGVTLDDLYAANPGLKENGLKNGSILLIPKGPGQGVQQETTEDSPVVTVKESKDDGSVEKDVSRRKKNGRKDKKDTETEDGGPFIRHTVKWYENLSSIAEEYGCTVEAIKKANGLKGNKLKKRQVLRIPLDLDNRNISDRHEKDLQTVGPEGQDLLQPEGKAKTETVTDGNDKKESDGRMTDLRNLFKKKKKEVDISMLLSLNTGTEEGKINSGNMDFYSGALLAARDAGREGIEVNLDIFDIAGHQLPDYETFRHSDVIIGPVSTRDLDSTFNINTDSCMVVSPLDPRAERLVDNHRNMIHVPSPQSRQYEDLLDWIRTDMGIEDRFIVIYESGSRELLPDSDVNRLLAASGIPYNTFNYGILEGRDITEKLESMMNVEGTNRFLIASESEAFVNDMVRNLNLLIHDKFNVIMYGPSKIRSFDTIETDNLHNTHFHCSLSYYIDYDDPEVQKFLLAYRALFKTEPSPFAYQGYDLTRYFTSIIHEYGKNWDLELTRTRKSMLQSDLDFRLSGENGGYVNHGIRRIIYQPDYSIQLMKGDSSR